MNFTIKLPFYAWIKLGSAGLLDCDRTSPDKVWVCLKIGMGTPKLWFSPWVSLQTQLQNGNPPTRHMKERNLNATDMLIPHGDTKRRIGQLI